MSLLLRSVPDAGRNSVEVKETVFAALRVGRITPLPISAWQRLALLFGAVSAIFLTLFWRTAWSIAETWYSSRTFSHGFLIIPMSLYLVWVRRGRLAALRPRPNFWGLPVLLALSCIWLAASLGDVRVVQQFALVAMIDVLVWTSLGTEVVRAMWFPLAFLFFAVPFGEAAISPLQDFTAHFAVAALGLSRVPVLLESRTIWVPSGPWVVAEACSGIRYLISSLVLGLIYASLVYRSKKRRILFVLASIVVPILANGIRAYGIILLAYLTNNRLAVGVDHIIYGWIFFTLVQLLLFWVGLRWRETPTWEPVAAEDQSPEATTGGYLLKKVAGASVLALMLVSLAPLAQAWLTRRAAAVAPEQFVAVVKAPWQPVASFDQRWTPLLHPAAEYRAAYAAGDNRVDLYLATYSPQQRVELVSGYNRISDRRSWSEFQGGNRRLMINGHAINVRWDVIRSDSGLRLVWTWYLAQGRFTDQPVEIKLLQAKGRLLGRPTPTAVISLSARYLLQPTEAESKMEDFLRHASIVATPLGGH